MKLGWLSPEGKLHECAYWGHFAMACKLVDEYNIDKRSMFDKGIFTEADMLLASGWTDIGKYNHKYSIIFPEDISEEIQKRIMHKRLMLSDEQKLFLKHLYDEEPENFSVTTLYWMNECGVEVY